MAIIKDRLWNWGQLEGCHYSFTGLDCKMTPEEFAKVYGIENAFIVSFAGNIKPPLDNFAKRFSCLKQVKWSVIGDASSPLPDSDHGDLDEILNVLDVAGNITGGVVDDFFSPERIKRFTPKVLKEIKARLNEKGLDFWCVLYNHQLDLNLQDYYDCFDGISFWIWGAHNLPNYAEYMDKVFEIFKGKPIMSGIYLYDYLDQGSKPIDATLFKGQLDYCYNLLKKGELQGIIFCSSTVGDADLESNKILKEFVALHGQEKIENT